MKLILLLCISPALLNAQTIKLAKEILEPVRVYMTFEKSIVRIVKDSTVKEVDEPTFVKIRGINFSDGTIEVSVMSKLLPSAPDFARGFIGMAFRVNEDNTKYESIYLRPTNARADNQVRRNHSIQYYSYPEYKFDRLRKEAPEQYESYADMALNEWIKMRIEVKGRQAKLFLNNNKQPSLIVSDLKHGETAGGIALWVDIGTEGYFKDISITK